jgi:hypothetical protein
MFARLFQSSRTRPSVRRQRGRLPRPLLEALEDRTLLSVYMVDSLGDTGQGSGLAGDLRYCITQATDGDAIEFGVQGIINLTGSLPDLAHSISIDGPGQDALTVSEANPTNGFRIFTVDQGATVAISDLTVTNGQSYDFASRGEGGGLLNDGTLTLSNTTFSGNAAIYGGAIYNGGTLTVSNSVLSGNTASANGMIDGGDGGAIDNHGTLTVSNSILSGNAAKDENGSAINSTSSNPLTITDTSISGNTGLASVVSVEDQSGTPGTTTISNCTITSNSSLVNGILGFDGLEDVAISNSSITDNTGAGSGGSRALCPVIRNSATLTVSNSTINGNTSGTGIYNFGTVTVSGSTISGNESGQGAGGIDNTPLTSGVSVRLFNCTISNNTGSSAHPTGSQLYTEKAAIELHNTIISGDGSQPNLFADNGGTVVSDGYNLSNDDGSGFLTGPGDLINTDPMLGPLQDNGGPTQTMALLPGSPAVNAGDPTNAPAYDQRGPGFPRIVQGMMDIGAFQTQVGAATQLAMSAPSSVTAGSPFDVTVTALDAYDHVASGYQGTIAFSTTDPDPGIVLPAAYTFTADDAGIHTFSAGVILITPGDQTLTVSDDGGISSSTSVTVTPTGGGAAAGYPGRSAPLRAAELWADSMQLHAHSERSVMGSTNTDEAQPRSELFSRTHRSHARTPQAGDLLFANYGNLVSEALP